MGTGYQKYKWTLVVKPLCPSHLGQKAMRHFTSTRVRVLKLANLDGRVMFRAPAGCSLVSKLTHLNGVNRRGGDDFSRP